MPVSAELEQIDGEIQDIFRALQKKGNRINTITEIYARELFGVVNIQQKITLEEEDRRNYRYVDCLLPGGTLDVGNDRFRLSLLATRRYQPDCGLARTRKKEKKQGRIKGKGEKKRETSTAREPRDGVANENLTGGIFFVAVFSTSSSPRLRRLGKEVVEASHLRQEEKTRR
ncbi:hypothetical protein B296_00031856, partial [Ensete ventricosum]